MEEPWGSLPVEQYILVNWDRSLTESIEQQRLRLIRQHLDADTIPPHDSDFRLHRPPLQTDVDTILRPWRSEKTRKAAIRQLDNGMVPLLLRTYYNPNASEREGDDAKLAGWIRADETFWDEADWACLDDPEIFNYGEEWDLIFDVIPELTIGSFSDPQLFTRPKFPPTDADLSLGEEWRDSFKKFLRIQKKMFPDEWKRSPHLVINKAAGSLHRMWCARPLVIVDKEAFETGYGRVIYIDSRRNIIRETRFDLNDPYCYLCDIIMDWFDYTYEEWLWMDSQVGEKYRVEGEFGQALYQLTDEDWADPEAEPLVTAQE